jgi:hypothetical protein
MSPGLASPALADQLDLTWLGLSGDLCSCVSAAVCFPWSARRRVRAQINKSTDRIGALNLPSALCRNQTERARSQEKGRRGAWIECRGEGERERKRKREAQEKRHARLDAR